MFGFVCTVAYGDDAIHHEVCYNTSRDVCLLSACNLIGEHYMSNVCVCVCVNVCTIPYL